MKTYISLFLGLLVFLAASVVADPIIAFSAGALTLAASSPYSVNKLACITTLSFDKNCGSNPGGLVSKIFIVKREDVDTIPAATLGVISSDIVLTALEEWAVWKGDKNMFKLDMNSVGEGDSKAWTSTLEMHRSGFSEGFEHHLSEQLNGEFVIVTLDRNGKRRILGDVNEGASFPSDGVVSTTGLSITEKNGNTLKFTWDSAYKPYFYEGLIAEKAVA